MKRIKFSKEYPKLWKQNKAVLIETTTIYPEHIHPDLLEYDTKADDGSYYKLPKTKMLQLFFVGEKGIPFCTIRRWTWEKEDYYRGLIGYNFEIVRTRDNKRNGSKK